MFKCGICGKEYNTIEERMKCEQKCYVEHVAEQERQKEEKYRLVAELKNSRKNARIKELQQEYEKFLSGVRQFNEDYNDPIKIDREYFDLINDLCFFHLYSVFFKEC